MDELQLTIYSVAIPFLLSVVLGWLFIPRVLILSHRKQLYDMPDQFIAVFMPQCNVFIDRHRQEHWGLHYNGYCSRDPVRFGFSCNPYSPG